MEYLSTAQLALFHGNTVKIKKNQKKNQLHLFRVCYIYYSRLSEKIMDALQDSDVTTHNDYTTMSRNYKLGVAHENMQASIQGNVIFDPSSQLPREVLLETTLKAFGFNMDIWEVCNTEGHKKKFATDIKAQKDL